MPADGDYEHDQGNTINGLDNNCDNPMRYQVTERDQRRLGECGIGTARTAGVSGNRGRFGFRDVS
jgi:hypothetical protein